MPERLTNFCAVSKQVLGKPPAANFVCHDQVYGAQGARADFGNTQVVLMRGAAKGWVMFAFDLQNGRDAVLDTEALDQLNAGFEQYYKSQPN